MNFLVKPVHHLELLKHWIGTLGLYPNKYLPCTFPFALGIVSGKFVAEAGIIWWYVSNILFYCLFISVTWNSHVSLNLYYSCTVSQAIDPLPFLVWAVVWGSFISNSKLYMYFWFTTNQTPEKCSSFIMHQNRNILIQMFCLNSLRLSDA